MRSLQTSLEPDIEMCERERMRSEHRAERTLLLLLIVKSAAVPITAIHAVDRWGKWPLILARPWGLGTGDGSFGGAAGAGIF